MIKTVNKLGMEGNILNLIRGIYKKHIANILNGERLNMSLLRSGRRQGYLLSPLLFNIGVEVLARQLSKKRK